MDSFCEKRGCKSIIKVVHALYFTIVITEKCPGTERKSYRFGTTQPWVYNDRTFIFGWTIPFYFNMKFQKPVPEHISLVLSTEAKCNRNSSSVIQDYQSQMKTLEQNISQINTWMDRAEETLDEMDSQGCIEHVIKVFSSTWQTLAMSCCNLQPTVLHYWGLEIVLCSHTFASN